MAESRWHRWQLTAPAAALSRPVRTRGLPDHAGRATGPAAAADATAEGLPVWLGTARAQQRDATSCGSAVLVMLAATGDPGLQRDPAPGRYRTPGRHQPATLALPRLLRTACATKKLPGMVLGL